MQIQADQIYINPDECAVTRVRRILGVIDDKVVYSNGGDKDRIIFLDSFKAYLRRTGAKLVSGPGADSGQAET